MYEIILLWSYFLKPYLQVYCAPFVCQVIHQREFVHNWFLSLLFSDTDWEGMPVPKTEPVYSKVLLAQVPMSWFIFPFCFCSALLDKIHTEHVIHPDSVRGLQLKRNQQFYGSYIMQRINPRSNYDEVRTQSCDTSAVDTLLPSLTSWCWYALILHFQHYFFVPQNLIRLLFKMTSKHTDFMYCQSLTCHWLTTGKLSVWFHAERALCDARFLGSIKAVYTSCTRE